MPANRPRGVLPIEPSYALELLREQAALFAKLETLAARQQALVDGEAIEPLLAVLADRQRVSVRLAEMADSLRPARQAWRELREEFDVSEGDEADGLIAVTEESLRRLIASDERDAHILSARKRRVANSLSGLTNTGCAVGAYHRNARSFDRVDLVSEDA